jgi:hypothetical protein
MWTWCAVYSKGNSATQYTLGSEVEYRRERWGFQTGFDSIFSSSAGAETATRNQFAVGGNQRESHDDSKEAPGCLWGRAIHSIQEDKPNAQSDFPSVDHRSRPILLQHQSLLLPEVV